MNKPGEELLEFIDSVLREDIRDGDHTTLATIDADAYGQAKLLVKEPGIVAGVDLAQWILQHVNSGNGSEHQHPRRGDGGTRRCGLHRLWPGAGLLVAERTMLNFMQRMSGIATRTNKYVQQVRHTKARILDTRKTSPDCDSSRNGPFGLEAGNHRMGLYDMIMIKDNHIDFCGASNPP